MFRRILGVIILLVSLILVAILLGGAFYVGQAVDAVGEGLDNVLDITGDTLDAVSMTLEQTKATIVEANNALDTAAEATVNLSKTMNDMQPLMESTTKVVAQDVPANIEAIQATIPNIVQVAGVIDNVLTKLSDFGISQTIPIPFNPIELNFDLGIDYEPDEPFDETISALGDSLEGMPEELRSLQGDLETLSADLVLLSGNIDTAAGDIEAMNEQIALFIPIMDEYLRIVGQIDDSLVQVKEQLSAQLDLVSTVLVGLLIFLTLTQIAPLYLGWELVSGQRPGQDPQKEIADAAPPVSPDNQDEEPPQPLNEEKTEIADKDVVDEPQEFDQATVVEERPEAAAETIVEQPVGNENPTVVEEPSQAPDPEGEEKQT
jgi:hypothetical protein